MARQFRSYRRQCSGFPLKTSVTELYGLRGLPKLTQFPMLADMIDEPDNDVVVDMLQALPREEAEYYAHQEKVVVPGASCESIFQDITEQCGFIGGELEQYIRYFARRLPRNMWAWSLENEVQAIAGFSTSPKKPRADGSIPPPEVAHVLPFELLHAGCTKSGRPWALGRRSPLTDDHPI